ncbi:MAG: hypothetical protein LBQ16_06690 [Gracilibacteraceae bacterium]|nr:hypothetical protein [Gracilibacteraceae bacterium]
MARRKKTVTLGLILLIIFFPPLGIGLLIYRLASNKTVFYEDGAALTKTGWVLAVIATFCLFGRWPPGFFFFGSLGVVILAYGYHARQKGKKFHQYALIVENSGTSPISSIAAAMGVSQAEAVADLTKMIEQGYFEKAYIDNSTGELVVLSVGGDAKAEKAKHKRVVCAGCGAAATVPAGRPALCEYCNSPLDTN